MLCFVEARLPHCSSFQHTHLLPANAVIAWQVPDIAAEGADFVRRLQSDNIWVVLVEKMRKGLG